MGTTTITVPRQKKKRKIDLLFITAAISTSLVLFLIGIITFLLLSAGRLSNNIREEMTVEVVLNDPLEQSDITDLMRSLQGEPFTKSCTYVSKEEALKEMSAEMGVDPSEFLQYNPFYASLSLQLKAEYANHDSLSAIIPAIQSDKRVHELNYQRELLDAVNDNITKVTAVLTVIALLLALISITLISNTIKLTIYSQRFILYSMKLVGAKWSFIRRPFIWRNLWIGIVAAVLACLMIWFGLHLGIRYEPGLAALHDRDLMLVVFGVMFVAGLLITWLCSLSSVNRFLKMKSGELHYI